MHNASRASTSISFGKSARPRREARAAPVPDAPAAPDSQALPPRTLRSAPTALPAGSGLQTTLNAALPDSAKWTGDGRMAPTIAAAAVTANARFAGLRVIPLRPDATEPIVRPGDLLEPSLRHDGRGEPVGGLHRGVSAVGFHDQASLLRAIETVSFFSGRQVVLVAGTASHRTDEDPEERIIVNARVLSTWFRRYSGGGRVLAWPPADHGDW